MKEARIEAHVSPNIQEKTEGGKKLPKKCVHEFKKTTDDGENRKAEANPSKKARDKTSRRQVETPKRARKKPEGRIGLKPPEINDDQAKYLGDFFEKVVPVRIAVEIVEDYKKEVEKELKLEGIDKNKYDDLGEYKKAVKEVSDEIAQRFKLFEERKARSEYRDMKTMRRDAWVNTIEVDNVFEGKSIKFAVKEGAVAKEEYENMLEFRKFFPDNLPKVYGYLQLEEKGELIMESLQRRTLDLVLRDATFDMDFALRVKPKLFFELGKIIGVWNDNNFIHGEPSPDNIILSKDYIWKLTDFELSKHYKNRVEAINDKRLFDDIIAVRIDAISTRFGNKQIKNDFYEGFLLNRNLKEDIRLISEEKLTDFDAPKQYMRRMVGVIENVSAPSKKIRDHLNSLINEIDGHLKEPVKDEEGAELLKERTKILKDFKKGLVNFLKKKTSAK